jgi:hypothetical protein
MRSLRRSRRATRALFAFEIAAALTWMGAVARADGPHGGVAEPLLSRIELTYSAPPECASRAEVTHAIARRIEPQWLAQADARRFSAVIVRADSTTYRGRLDVEHSGRVHTREISGSTCKEVTTALAVFIAIALDPVTADDTEELPRSPPPPPSEDEPPEKSVRLVLPPTLPSSRPSGAPPKSAPASRSHWTWSSTVSFTYLRVPEAASGARVSAQLNRNVAGARLSPALRASWGFADFTTLPERAGRVAFRLETAQVAGCLVVSFAPMPLTLAPCAGADVGTLASTARDLPRGTHVEGRWIAAHAFARAAWALLPWLTLELEAGALVPLERSLYALSEPARVAYRAPSVLFSSSVGLGIQARF